MPIFKDNSKIWNLCGLHVSAIQVATLLGFNIHSFCCNKIEKSIRLGHYVATLRAVFTKFEMSIPLNVLILFICKINYI